ncbi:MAG TPA: Lrp/AsnC family transcriptional regulator [Burkholderiales bacterium]
MDAAFDPGLANAWQRDFPLVPRPFADIAAGCGSDEDAVIKQFQLMKQQGLIDRIGPVFRPNTVGASCLAAMEVAPARLEEVAALVSGYRGVNHNSEREHRYNLWFVVTGRSEPEVQWTLSCIEYAARLPVLRLPLVEEYHIDLGFDLATGLAPRAPRDVRALVLDDEDKELVTRIAAGLPLVTQPYAALGFPEAQVIDTLGRWLEAGIVRRIGAVLRHRALGFQANAMLVWDVPDERVAQAGSRLAADPAVTLCYRRARALPEWPYNLYCMVHGREQGRVLYEAKRISLSLGLAGFARAILFSRRCFTQRAARYG